MFSSLRAVYVAVALVLGLVSNGRAAAQGPAQLDLFRPAPIDGDGLAVAHAVSQGHLRFGAQLALDYANDPLVWETRPGMAASESRHIVRHQLVAHAYASLGLFNRLVLFAGVPVNVVQSGQRTQDLDIPPADGAGIGNPLFGARVLLLPQRTSGFGLALQAEVTFPLASAVNSSQSYTGDGRVTFFPQAIAHYEAGILRVALNLGYRIRKDQSFAALDFGDELTFGLGARFRVERRSTLLAEIHGSSTTTNVFGRAETPVELLGGYEFQHESGVTLMAGAGAGSRGFGAPDVRALLGLRYTTRARAVPAPEAEEPEDEVAAVETPAEEPLPVVEETPVDTTAPVIADATVPAEPIEDADGDGFENSEDDCPDLAGIAEFRGCPRAPLLVINERIYFEFDSARLDEPSRRVLDGIAAIILAHPEVRVVRVEGHADTRGPHEYNIELSRRRADAVTHRLVRHGVLRRRIVIEGFGHTARAEPDADEEHEHARNRRVEFRIVGVE